MNRCSTAVYFLTTYLKVTVFLKTFLNNFCLMQKDENYHTILFNAVVFLKAHRTKKFQ